jgi:hypothetical protein
MGNCTMTKYTFSHLTDGTLTLGRFAPSAVSLRQKAKSVARRVRDYSAATLGLVSDESDRESLNPRYPSATISSQCFQ